MQTKVVNKADVHVMEINLSLMWTRGLKRKVFTVSGDNLSFYNGMAGAGEEASLDSIDAHINNFEFYLKYLTPSDQIKKKNLNYMLEQRGDMVKSYITQVCCVTKSPSKETANVSFTNSLPYLYCA